MKNKRFWDVLLKVIVAAITAAATALGTNVWDSDHFRRTRITRI